MQRNPRSEIVSALYKIRFTRFLNSRMLPNPPKGCCKWCGGEATRVWCSPECRQEGYIRMGYYQKYVFERDRAICAKCGIDTKWLGAKIEEIQSLWKRYRPVSVSQYVTDFGPWGIEAYKQFWEADHILPVCEGGGCCGLENYQTLCLKCHKEETAGLSKRRAAKPVGQLIFSYP